MGSWRTLRIGLLLFVLFAVAFSAAGVARGAQAQFAKDIIDTDNGTKTGGITFPKASTTDAAGVEIDLQSVTEAHIGP